MKIKFIILLTAGLLSLTNLTHAEDNAIFTTAPIEVIETDELTNEMVIDLHKKQMPVLLKGAAKSPL